MKLLMMYAKEIAYTPKVKNLETAEDKTETEKFENILVAFIHAEEQDEKDFKETETKLIKNLKWGARKNETKRILLHSFAHLSSSKASPEFTKELFDKVEERLNNSDYESFQSPFGYFLDLNMNLPGYSQARIFREFNRTTKDCDDNDTES